MLGIGLTSIIGWGTSFSAIAILGTIIGRDLGLSREVIFGGITVMLVVSGLVAPRCGRLIDREGPRKVMTFGSALCAVALALMARVERRDQLLGCVGLFGVAVPLAMSNAAVTAIAQVAGRHARRAITGLTILGRFDVGDIPAVHGMARGALRLACDTGAVCSGASCHLPAGASVGVAVSKRPRHRRRRQVVTPKAMRRGMVCCRKPRGRVRSG